MSFDLPFLSELKNRIASAQGRPVVGIVGPPACGKSTTAARLVGEIGDESAIVVGMDGYHLPNEHLQTTGLYPWKGCHFTFDSREFVDAIQSVKKELAPMSLPKYDRAVYHDPIPDGIKVGPQHRYVVVEGNYLLLDVEPWSKLISIWDYSIFIDVGQSVQLERLMQRHMLAGKSEREAYEKIYSTDLPNSHMIRACQDRADYVLRPQANFAD